MWCFLQDELSLEGYRKFEESKNAAPPLTNAEMELMKLKESEVRGQWSSYASPNTQHSHALQDHTDVGTGSHLHGVAFPVQPEALDAIKQFKRNEVTYIQMVCEIVC